MNYLDVYYRALLDYRKSTTASRECGSQRSATAKANAKADNVTVVRKICTVETDWIEAIEEGLVHVDKAIREERQFIRSNGEVVDIEKVKHVSKDSVEHLAHHSNLITRFEEGKDIVPDRLYTVERLNDYAVYENRFLYMLLCYLRDFITIRYNKILDLEHTYNGSMTMSKRVVMPKRHLSLDIKLEEDRKDDPYLKERSASKEVIGRIRDILELVHAFLATPLMEEVGKVAMLKPPITKTNVLRMNHNFRGALALYEYVTAYDKDGYTVSEEVHKLQPFRMDMADEFSEIVLLASFLTYEYGMNIKDALRIGYEKEEEKRRREEQARHLEQIKALRRRIRESGESPEEYMLMLEKRNRVLENDSLQLVQALQKIEDLEGSIARLEAEKKDLLAVLERAAAEAIALKEAHLNEVAQLNAEHSLEIERLKGEHAEELARLDTEHQAEISALEEQLDAACEAHRIAMEKAEAGYLTAMEEAESNHRAALETTREIYRRQSEDIQAKWQADSRQWEASCQEKDEKLAACTAENEALLTARRLSDARLHALRREHGLMTPADDFTSKEAFEELEHEFEIFKSLFKKEWHKTKGAIRKSAFRSFKDAIKEGREKEFLAGIKPEAASAEKDVLSGIEETAEAETSAEQTAQPETAQEVQSESEKKQEET